VVDQPGTPNSFPKKYAVAVILGSAFSKQPPQGFELQPLPVDTPWGTVTLYRVINVREYGDAYIIFRHGLPHTTLPHLVNFRGYVAALKQMNCKALLITSSVGVLDENIPLNQPMLVSDLLMPDNRLPNGELCTMFTDQIDLTQCSPSLQEALRPGHLVLTNGLFSAHLGAQIREILDAQKIETVKTLIFAYAPGPRTKTSVENQYWRHLGAQVNSMSVGPEVILANELEIPTAVLVVGHKRSLGTKYMNSLETKPSRSASNHHHDVREMTETLKRSHDQLEKLIIHFIQRVEPTLFDNYIYRFTV
jgi:5'-methylthioadenosine phosphorylase